MKERPIIFPGEMVNAILAGKKTQTRRVVKPQQRTSSPWGYGYICPYAVGMTLWVRETWGEFFDDELPPERYRGAEGKMGIPAYPERKVFVFYRADGEIPDHSEYGKALWRPSTYMPRWASRITLEITDIRVERLQDITEEDAKAEGFEETVARRNEDGGIFSAVKMFWGDWNGLHAKNGFGWDKNPYVWVLSFRRTD